MKISYILFLLMIIPIVSAIQPTQQYAKSFLSPFYVNSMQQNYRYNYSVDIHTPDGISQIKSAIVTLDAWINPTRVFNAWMNNIQCNTANYTISTSFASAGRGVVTFDCSNAVMPNNLNTVSFSVSGGNIGSSTAWIELSYQNNPLGDIKIHGTEYTYGQISKAWLQLLNSSGDHINSGVCYVDIYNPNMSQFIERATMSNSMHDGLYSYDVELPFAEGVYPVIALCYYIAGQTYNYATNITMINGTLDSGNINDTRISDGTYLLTTESPASLGNPRRYDSKMYFRESKICSNISESLLNGISIGWTGRWNSNLGTDVMTMSLWNYTSSSWYVMPNTITGVGTGVKTVTNSLSFNNISAQGFVNGSGTNLILRFQDTTLADTVSSGFDYDYVYVACDQLAYPTWQSLRGSSEFHLSRSLNESINASFDTSMIPEQVWNYSMRNLTYYPLMVVTTQNITVQNTTVYVNNVSVTVQNVSVNNVSVYVTNITIDTSMIASDVWNYSMRNLTYYPIQHDMTNYSFISENVWSYVGRYIHGIII